ncbi:hypothetical protein [Marinobacter bohaiensis]|uniref:hypothetical protein n=1 Tax=Marinobacter bohaiensis TaxID=2201898 RepID=UPI000DAE134F|nr:hypothetical protein [Marinobacter bohaiensis]
MANLHRILASLAGTLLLAGCGGSSDGDSDPASCGSQFNPATRVQAGYASFDITAPGRLQRHLFRDVLAGVQPAGADAYGESVADDVLAQTARFNGGSPASGASAYTAVRNPMDFIDLIIGEDTIDNFNTGRRYISSCIDAGNAAQYDTSEKGALVTFDEVQDSTTTDQYNYPNLRWVYAPDASGKVIRVIRFQGRSGEDLNGAVVASQFDDASFSASGFNVPELVQASFTAGSNQERLSLEQTLIDLDRDQWLRSSDNTFDFADRTDVDCARVLVDYRAATAEVFTSAYANVSGSYASRSAYVESEDYCGNQEEGTGTRYATQAVSGRQ